MLEAEASIRKSLANFRLRSSDTLYPAMQFPVSEESDQVVAVVFKD
jgi:hypothetical protein